MKGFILTLVVCAQYVGGALRYPNFHKLPAMDTNLPTISQEDIELAFSYAEEQHNKKVQVEDEYLHSGGALQQIISAENRLFAVIVNKSMEQHRIQEKLEDATKFIARKYNLTKAQARGLQTMKLSEDIPLLKECLSHRKTAPCDGSYKYRSIDGSCNNLQNPNWGRSFTSGFRLNNAEYDDGMMSLRKSKNGEDLPNPRLISITISPDVDVPSKNVTHMVMSVSQYMNHDLTQIVPGRAGSNNDGIFSCCLKNISVPHPTSCMPVELSKDDVMYLTDKRDCMSVVRSTTSSLSCSLGNSRLPIQQQTSFIDASLVYGASDEESLFLRSLKGGELRTQMTDQGELLPETPFPDIDQCSGTLKTHKCFIGGDFRTNLHPGILGIQTLAVRQHNRNARTLAAQYPSKSDEEIFQEARRILIAQISVIIYKEFLPLLVGPDMMKYFNLHILEGGHTEYDPTINPTVPVEFNTGAFRFGHSLVQNSFTKVDQNGIVTGSLDFHTTQLGVFPEDFYKGDLDSYIRGHFYQKSQEMDRFYVDSMSNHCLRSPFEKFGFDLVLLEIVRGRDHGLPTYVAMLDFCFNLTIQSFDDLNITMSATNIEKLKSVYKYVEDVDYYMGGLLETSIEGGIMGPTFACVTGQHFHDLKFGDRFHFEHADQAGSFTEDQRTEIRKTTLSGFICENSDNMEAITQDPESPISDTNPLTKCEDFPRMNLTNWLTT